jgi:MFS family permease
MRTRAPVARAADRRQNDPSLRASIRDGMSYSVMVGSGETYLGPFGIFLHATTLQIGLLATLPQLLGAVMQWVGAVAIEGFKSRRAAVVAGVTVQALMWLPIALIPFTLGSGIGPAFALIALVAVYHSAHGFAIPIWNSLIGDLVPADIRGRFFGRRNRQNGISTFVTLVAAGGILDVFERFGRVAFGFLIIFTVACAARLNSARWLARYADPRFEVSAEQRFTFGQFLRRSPQSNFAKFVFFFATVSFAVAFSGPYFALYMLRELNLSYVEFTAVTAASTITQFLAFSYWGELTDRFGNKKILNICGWGIGIVPLLWLFSPALWYMMVIQVYGGFVWAGFSLAAANFMFDAVSPPKRARCAAYQGMVNGVCVFAGSLLGGFVAGHLPASFTVFGWTWTPVSTLLFIFLISGFMRLVTAAIALRHFKEVRDVERVSHHDLIFTITQLKPIAGATFDLITGLFRDHDRNSKRR